MKDQSDGGSYFPQLETLTAKGDESAAFSYKHGDKPYKHGPSMRDFFAEGTKNALVKDFLEWRRQNPGEFEPGFHLCQKARTIAEISYDVAQAMVDEMKRRDDDQ